MNINNYKIILVLFGILLSSSASSGKSTSSTGPNNETKKSIPKEILNAFYNHSKSIEKALHKRLTKDSRGYSDAYILYDMQTYLQNIAILADERVNQEVLKELLKLVSIPFEPRYLSNGKWLEGKEKSLIGKEPDLAIIQFFGLLTRVLDACARHGVPTITFSKSSINLGIIRDHISNSWKKRKIDYTIVTDFHLYCIMSSIHFQRYLDQIKQVNDDFDKWKSYVQDYVNNVVLPLWAIIPCSGSTANKTCTVLAKDAWIKHRDFKYSAYGSEIKDIKSNTNPKAMFYANGTIKQAPIKASTGATDISHARRFNWFFETIKRFGKQPFNVSIPEKWFQGWANNLAYNVCKGTESSPYFTIYSDGTDGWYRVGYAGRLGFGYSPGDHEMDIHFVASSYGIMGIYNPKIRTWMKAWVDKNIRKIYDDTPRKLDYLTSMLIDIQKPIKFK